MAYKQSWNELASLLVLLESSGVEVVSIAFMLRLMSIILTMYNARPKLDES
jgi:hypothetical protein